MKIVVALGGNALGATPTSQKEKAKATASYLVPLIEAGHELIITHGNGPQVGLINLAFTEGHKQNERVLEMPFAECGAMSEGYIGFHLQNAIANELSQKGIKRSVYCIITQVEVDPLDPAFKNPTKPIGSFYTKEEASLLPYPTKEDAGRGYRRVIASPKPKAVVEIEAIKKNVSDGHIVITCGGGGIPVIKENNQYQGIDAVIDKDFASSVLADSLSADMLLILTAVPCVCLNYNTPDVKELKEISVKEAKQYLQEGHFYEGSMKPKIEACINFVEHHQNRYALITSIDKAIEALNGVTGTKIYN